MRSDDFEIEIMRLTDGTFAGALAARNGSWRQPLFTAVYRADAGRLATALAEEYGVPLASVTWRALTPRAQDRTSPRTIQGSVGGVPCIHGDGITLSAMKRDNFSLHELGRGAGISLGQYRGLENATSAAIDWARRLGRPLMAYAWTDQMDRFKG